MNKKKVLIVSDYFIPHWTGIATSLSYFIDQYNAIYDFTVLTIKHGNTLPTNEHFHGANIIRVPYQLSLSRAKYSFLFLPTFITMFLTFDTIFINSPNSNILFVTLLCTLFRKRVVIFHQGDLILTKSFFNRIVEKIFDFHTHFSCTMANAVATYTQDYAEHSRILSNHLDKLHTFLFIPKKKTAIAKRFSGIEKQKQKGLSIFGFAGRYVEEKGIDILLSSIKKVIQKKKNVHFYFAGDAMSYEKNDYFSKTNDLFGFITNLGLLDTISMSSFLSSLDFLIIPSRSDCFPLVQIEALQQGTPIIASNTPGIRVPVMKTHYGFLFENKNVTDLANKIVYSISGRKKLTQYKKNVDILLNQTTYDATIKTFIG